MLLRLTLAQARATILANRAIAQAARATMDAVIDKVPHTPIEQTADGMYARLSFGWVKV